MKHFHDYLVRGGESPEPQRHTPANLLAEEFNVDKGLITWAGVFFPPGCRSRVYAKIYFQAHQILPRNQEAWCHGNNGWWGGLMEFPVTAAPLTIKTEAYQDACSFNHWITVGLELTPWHMVPRWDKILLHFREFFRAIGIPAPKEVLEEYAP